MDRDPGEGRGHAFSTVQLCCFWGSIFSQVREIWSEDGSPRLSPGLQLQVCEPSPEPVAVLVSIVWTLNLLWDNQGPREPQGGRQTSRQTGVQSMSPRTQGPGRLSHELGTKPTFPESVSP